jgi:hypothetical protein
MIIPLLVTVVETLTEFVMTADTHTFLLIIADIHAYETMYLDEDGQRV